MLNNHKILWILPLVFLMSSCGMFRDKNLAKRYRNNRNEGTFANSVDPQTFVQVDLQTILVNEPKEKEVKYNLLSLSDKGQEAFINSINAKSTSSGQLVDLLTTNFNFSKEEKPKIKIIPKTIKKTLLFTVDRLKYHFDPITKTTTFNTLGDRISFLELSVQLAPSTNAIFNSWDKYVTDKITLNLGKVSSAQNWNASLSLSAKGVAETSLSGSNTTEDFNSDKNSNTTTLVNTGSGNSNTNANSYELLSTDKGVGSNTKSLKASGELGGNATVGFSDKYETSLDLSSQILKLSGTLAENKILLRQEGGPGIDLSGNIVVSVEYAITDDWAPPVQFIKAGNLYNAGVPNPLGSMTTSFLTVIFPDIKNNVKGELDYSFLYRQVNKGNKHLPEARQKVKYRYGNVPYSDNSVINKSLVDLVKTQDIRPKAYVLRLVGGSVNLALNGREIKFETTAEAAIFLTYVKDLTQAGLALNSLTINGAALTSADVANLILVTLQL